MTKSTKPTYAELAQKVVELETKVKIYQQFISKSNFQAFVEKPEIGFKER